MTPRTGGDPPTSAIAADRLARLLDDAGAGRAIGPSEALSADVVTEPRLGPADALERARGFGRRHLGVLGLVLVVGLVAAGWSLLRARPVADAAPLVEQTAAGRETGPSARGTPAPVAPRMLVHVLGAVRRPGVVSLADRARVQDAVAAAGGLRANADPGELNLAQVLTDGEQVVIGTQANPGGEVRDGGGTAGAGATGPPGAGAAGVLDLNRADAVQLDQGLPGVGPVTAARIVAWRTEHGRFDRVEELQEVDGIGPKTYAQIAPHVRV